MDGCAGTFPVRKRLPPSSREEALPLFELEEGTWVALSKEGSGRGSDGEQLPFKPCRGWGLAKAPGFGGTREDLSAVLTSHLQENSLCWFAHLWGQSQLGAASPGAMWGTALMEQSN